MNSVLLAYSRLGLLSTLILLHVKCTHCSTSTPSRCTFYSSPTPSKCTQYSSPTVGKCTQYSSPTLKKVLTSPVLLQVRCTHYSSPTLGKVYPLIWTFSGSGVLTTLAFLQVSVLSTLVVTPGKVHALL